MDGGLPLPALLSQALVAFTIEFDNEFERQMPHRTTNHGATSLSRGTPWLVSMVMWRKFLRLIPDEGITIRELNTRLHMDGKDLRAWLTRLSKWWGYLAFHQDVVRPTIAGSQARKVWEPLTSTIEKRWETRFGESPIDDLREALAAVVSRLAVIRVDTDLPGHLPILGYGLFSQADHTVSAADLPGLLSKVLLEFAIEFERDSEISLAIYANVLRLSGEKVRVRDLPRMAGVSKEAIATALSFLEKRGFAAIEPVRVLALTPKGQDARNRCRERMQAIEESWQSRFGDDVIRRLRKALERLLADPAFHSGLEPHPGGWRASVPRPEGLPHYPMILHRGGFPDGS